MRRTAGPISARLRCVSAVVAALTLFSSCSTSSAQAPQQPPEIQRFLHSRAAQTDKDGFYHQPAGLCEDYPDETTTSAKIQRDFAVLRETGTKLLRFGIGWDGIEEAPDEYNWRFWDEIVEAAEREGVTLLPYVCYTPRWLGNHPENFWREPPRDLERFGKFMFVIAHRYRGQIRSWELWNEPDNRDYWLGSAKQFARMFRGGAEAVRRADAQALVVLGGMAGEADSNLMQSLTQNHELGRWFDVINFHSYFETWDKSAAEELPRRIAQYREAARTFARDSAAAPDLWLAEFGYSSATPKSGRISRWVKSAYEFEHTREFQAVALLRHHVLALAAEQLSLTAWFRIHDLPVSEGVIGDDNNRHFGVLDVEGDPKPAFGAMRMWNRIFDQPVRRIPAAVNGNSNARVYAFQKKDGGVVVAAWLPLRASGRGTSGVAKTAGPRQQVNIRLALPAGAVVAVYTPTGERMRELPASGDIIENVELSADSIVFAEVNPAIVNPQQSISTSAPPQRQSEHP